MQTGITLYPNVTYNYLLVQNKIATSDEIQKMDNIQDKPTWNTVPNTLIFAPYITDDISSFISGLNNPIIGWRVYRRSLLEDKQVFVADVEPTNTVVIDYLCANQTEYQYLILPITDYEVGLTLESEIVKTDWWNYCLMGIREIKPNVYAPTEVWTFDANLTSTDIVQNTDIATFKTFSRTPKIVKGESNYQTMGISCLLGGVSCSNYEYTESAYLLQKWQEFITSTNLYVWKDRKGMIKVGVIDANPSSKYMDECVLQPTTITFNFVETMDVDKIQVFDSLGEIPDKPLHNVFYKLEVDK